MTHRTADKGFCSKACAGAYRHYQYEYKRLEIRRCQELGLLPTAANKGRAESFGTAIAKLIAALKKVARRKPVVCEVCGKAFRIKRHGRGDTKYCSRECRRRSDASRLARRMASSRRRAREKGAKYESVDPYEIFERDGWRCQACGRKTPKRKRGTTAPNAPELDHIYPLSKGGEHVRTNLQCLCRECNQEKSDRGGCGTGLLF